MWPEGFEYFTDVCAVERIILNEFCVAPTEGCTPLVQISMCGLGHVDKPSILPSEGMEIFLYLLPKSMARRSKKKKDEEELSQEDLDKMDPLEGTFAQAVANHSERMATISKQFARLCAIARYCKGCGGK